MLIISPWTRGGFVNSQLFDHTSVIRFLEARFGVIEPNITPWRRAVCGDLTSAFDFSAGDKGWDATLPDTSQYGAIAAAARALPAVTPQPAGALPVQEKGQRPARPLPYALEVTGKPRDGNFVLTLENSGAAAACLSVYAKEKGPWLYTCGAGETLADSLPLLADEYCFRVHGPNGFLRVFQDVEPYCALMVKSRYDPTTQKLVVVLHNPGTTAREVTTRALRYAPAALRTYRLAAGATAQDRWAIAPNDHWYDVEVRSQNAVWQLAGHMETGRVSRSDPALG